MFFKRVAAYLMAGSLNRFAENHSARRRLALSPGRVFRQWPETPRSESEVDISVQR